MYVVMSGLPCSGKTTLGRRIATEFGLPLIDKDDILEQLFEARGVGDSSWRRVLSRESDVLFRERALASPSGAVLVSFWRVPGMAADSGTTLDWIHETGTPIVHVRCDCDTETATSRFHSRVRHPGHLDASRSVEEIRHSIYAIAALPALDLRPTVVVDTSREVDFETIRTWITSARAESVGARRL